MARFGKLPTLLLLLGIAALVAGLFGMLHNQISYSVGPSYFTGLKFTQFDIPDALPPRLGAALVGWLASWWMGPLAGLPAFLLGLWLVPTARSYLAAGLAGIVLAVGSAALLAAMGLIAGLAITDNPAVTGQIPLPPGVTERDFLRAGFMHEASYLGGALGGLAAIWPMLRARRIDKTNTTAATQAKGGTDAEA